MFDIFSNPFTQAILGLIAIIILILMITCGVFYFKSMYYENQMEKEKAKNAQIENDLKIYKAKEQAEKKIQDTKDQIKKKQKETQQKIEDIQKKTEENKKTIEETLKEREHKELTGEYKYDNCPDTKKEIEMLNNLLKQINENTN